MSSEPIKIGIAELKTALFPCNIIYCWSRVMYGVCLWDPKIKLGNCTYYVARQYFGT